MLFGTEAERQKFRQGHGFDTALRADHVDPEIVTAKFPHHLPANAAGGEGSGDDAVLAAADRNGGKIPVAVIDCLEESRPFCAVVGP